jgi:hypothetical protein
MSWLLCCGRLFSSVVLPVTDKPVLKVPSKLKEGIKAAQAEVDKRLKEEQKIVCMSYEHSQYIETCE